MSAPSEHSHSSARSSEVPLGSIEQDLMRLMALLEDSLERSRKLQESLVKNRACLDQSVEESRLLRKALEESKARLEESMRRRRTAWERRFRDSLSPRGPRATSDDGHREGRFRDSLSRRDSRPTSDDGHRARVEEASESRESSGLEYTDGEPERELPPLPVTEEPAPSRPPVEEESCGGLLRRLIQVNHENHQRMMLAMHETYRGMAQVKHRHALEMIATVKGGSRPPQTR